MATTFLLNSEWTAESVLPEGYTFGLNAFSDITVALSKATAGDELTIENRGAEYTLAAFDASALTSLTLVGAYSGKAVAGGNIIFNKDGSFNGTSFSVGIPAQEDPAVTAVDGTLTVNGAIFAASSGVTAGTDKAVINLVITGDVAANTALFSAKPLTGQDITVNISVADSVALGDTYILNTIYALTATSGAVSANYDAIDYVLSDALTEAGYGILKTYSGVFLTTAVYDMSTIVANSEWAGTSTGETVSYNGKDYVFGINAFATAQEAFATAKINTDKEIVTDVILADTFYSMPSPSNQGFNTAYFGNWTLNSDKQVTIYASGWDGWASGSNNGTVGAGDEMTHFVLGENITVKEKGRTRFAGTTDIYGTLLSTSEPGSEYAGEAFIYWGANNNYCINIYSTGTFGQGKSSYISGTIGGNINVIGNGTNFRSTGQWVATKDSTTGDFSAWTALKVQAKTTDTNAGTVTITDYGFAEIYNSIGFGTTAADYEGGTAGMSQLIMDTGKFYAAKQFYFGYTAATTEGYATADIKGDSYIYANEYHLSSLGVWKQAYTSALEYGKSFDLVDGSTFEVTLDGMDATAEGAKSVCVFVANLAGTASTSLANIKYTINGAEATSDQKAATGYTFVTGDAAHYAYFEATEYSDVIVNAAWADTADKTLVGFVDGNGVVTGINGYAKMDDALTVAAENATITNAGDAALEVENLAAGDGLTLKGAYTIKNLTGNLIVGNGGAVSATGTIDGTVTVVGGGSFTAGEGMTGTATYSIVLDANTDASAAILTVKPTTTATTISVSCAEGFTASGMYKLSDPTALTSTSGAVNANYTLLNYELSGDLVDAGYGIVKTVNGVFMTTETYDLTTIVANDQWATGYSIGDTVEYAGKTYTFGYNAFATFQEAMATAKYNYDPEQNINVIAASDFVLEDASNSSLNFAYYSNITVSGAVGGSTTIKAFGFDGWASQTATGVTGQRGQTGVIGENVTLNVGGRIRMVGQYDVYGTWYTNEDYSTESFIRGGSADYDFQMNVYSTGSVTWARSQAFCGYISVIGDGKAVAANPQFLLKDGNYGNGFQVITYADKENSGVLEAKDYGYAKLTTATYLGSTYKNESGEYVIPEVRVSNHGKMEFAATGDSDKLNGALFVGYTSATATADTYGTVTVTGDSDLIATKFDVSNYGKMVIDYTSTITYRDSYYTDTKFAAGSFSIAAGDSAAGTKDGDVSIDFTGMNSETGSVFYAIVNGVGASGTNTNFDKIYYTIDGVTKSAADVKEATGYSIINDGKNVYAVQGSALSKMAVSDSWAAGYEFGQKITVDGYDYFYGITAFGDVTTAFSAAGSASVDLMEQVTLTVVDAATSASGFTHFGVDGYNVKVAGYSTTGGDVTVKVAFYGQDDTASYANHIGNLVIDSSVTSFGSSSNFGVGGVYDIYTAVTAGEVLALDGLDSETKTATVNIYEGGHFINGAYLNMTAWGDATVTINSIGNGVAYGAEQMFVYSPWTTNATGIWNFGAKEYGVGTFEARDGVAVTLGDKAASSIILDSGKMNLTGTGSFILGAKMTTTLTGNSTLNIEATKGLTLLEGATINSVYSSTINYAGSLTGAGTIVIAIDGLSSDSAKAMYTVITGGKTDGEAITNYSFTQDGKAISAADIKTATGYEVKTTGNIIYLYDATKADTQLAVKSSWAGSESEANVIFSDGSIYQFGVNGFAIVGDDVNAKIKSNAANEKATYISLDTEATANAYKIAGGATVNLSGTQTGRNATVAHADGSYNVLDAAGAVTTTGYTLNLEGNLAFNYMYMNNNSTFNFNAGTFDMETYNNYGSGNVNISADATMTVGSNFNVLGNTVINGTVKGNNTNVYGGYLDIEGATAQSGHLTINEGGSFDAGSGVMTLGALRTDNKYNGAAKEGDVITPTVDVVGGTLTATNGVDLGAAKAGVLNVTEGGSATIGTLTSTVAGGQLNVFGGKVDVTGAITGANIDLSIADGTFNATYVGTPIIGSLSITGDSTAKFDGGFTVNGAATIGAGSTVTGQQFQFKGATEIAGTISVSSNLILYSDATISGTVNLTGDYSQITVKSGDTVITSAATVNNLYGISVAFGANLTIDGNSTLAYKYEITVAGGTAITVDMKNFVATDTVTYIIDGRNSTGGFTGEIAYDFGDMTMEAWKAATGNKIVRDNKSVYIVEGTKNDSIALNSAYADLALYDKVVVGETTYVVGIDAFASFSAAAAADAYSEKYVITQNLFGNVDADYADVTFTQSGLVQDGAQMNVGGFSVQSGSSMVLSGLTLSASGADKSSIDALTLYSESGDVVVDIAATDTLAVKDLTIASNTALTGLGTLAISGSVTLAAGVNFQVSKDTLAALAQIKSLSFGEGATITVTDQLSDADVERYKRIFGGNVVFAGNTEDAPKVVDVTDLGSDADAIAKLSGETATVTGDKTVATNTLVLNNASNDLSGISYVMRGTSKNTVTVAAAGVNFGNIANASAVTLNAANKKTGAAAATAVFGNIATGTGKTTITLNKETTLTAASLSKVLGGSNVLSMADSTTANIGSASDLASVTLGKASNLTIGATTAAEGTESNVVTTVGSFSLKTGADSNVTIYDTVAAYDGTKNTFSFGANNTITMAGIKATAATTISVANATKDSSGQFGYTAASFGTVDLFGKSSITVGNYVNASVDTINANVSAQSAAITLKVGMNSTFTAGDLNGIGTFSFTANGKGSDGLIIETESKVGDINGALSTVTAITVGKGITLTAADVALGDGKNTVTISDGANMVADTLGGAVTIKIGKDSSLNVKGDLTLASGLTTAITVGDTSSIIVSGAVVDSIVGGALTLTLGKDSDASFASALSEVSKITTGSAKNDTEATSLTAGDITGTAGKDTYTIGNYNKVNVGNIFTGNSDDTIKIGNFSTVYASDIDFGDGTKDALTVGASSSLFLGYDSNVAPTGTMGGINGVNKVTVTKGTANATSALVAAGDIIMTDGADTIDFGNYSSTRVAAIDFGEGTKDTLKIGTDSTAIFTGDITGLDVVTIGKNTKIAASKETINTINAAGSNKGSKIDASVEFISLGDAATASLFTTYANENTDNDDDSVASLADGAQGWLGTCGNESSCAKIACDNKDVFSLADSAWKAGDTALAENWVVEGTGIKVELKQLVEVGGQDIWQVAGTVDATTALNQIAIDSAATAIKVSVSLEDTETAGAYSYKLVNKIA